MANIFRTSNPTLKPNTFENSRAILGHEVMTLQGTINKTGMLLLCVVGAAAWTWGLARSESPEAVLPWMLRGVIGGFILALVTVFKKEWSPITAPLYALLEGLALGGISSFLRCEVSGYCHSGRRTHVRDALRDAVSVYDSACSVRPANS